MDASFLLMADGRRSPRVAARASAAAPPERPDGDASSGRRALGRAWPAWAALLFVGACALSPASARASDGPRLASDAFMLGGRLGPGGALLLGWDLDVYLGRSRALSVGPGLSLAVLASDRDDGTGQELLISVDALRLKVGLNESGQELRPHLIAGAGFYYVRLSEAAESDVSLLLADGSTATGTREHAAFDGFGALMTLGLGVDVFFSRYLGLTLQALTHVRLSGTDRLLPVWSELSVGLRFGI